MNEMLLLKTPHAYETPVLSLEEKHVFLQETLDLFSRRRQGHMIHRCYMTPAALYYGGKFTSTPENYMKGGEISVIFHHAAHIGESALHPHGIIGIENGPGMESAMRCKSAPFFRAMPNIHTYIGRDLSAASIDLLPNVMEEELPNVRIVGANVDYLKTRLSADLGAGRRVMAEFGMTRGNMEGFPDDGFPYHIIKADMAFHRTQMSPGDIYAFTFDSNQNGASVEAAYNSEWTTLWARELINSMKRELPIQGDLDAEGFHFRCIWNAASHGGFNHIVADRRMEFAINGIPFTVYKGDGFGITNSYKMPVEYAEALADDTGWKFNLYQDADKRISMPAYTAA